jgi:predicted short-subunit dehydrogenase-like oxidoreductase (DUF2520 family)
MAKPIQSVSIVGAGNVATHLAQELQDNGVQVGCVYSRNQESARTLANLLRCDAISDLKHIPEKDLVLVCVSDDAISAVLGQIPPVYSVAYTSGSVEVDHLPQRKNLGVFYPLQTFSKQKKVNIFEVPFLIEATNTEFAQSLFDLAWKLSRKVQFASSEERKHLHLGAVLVNNFTNHIAFLAKEYLDKHQLDFELLKPLMQETFDKLKTTEPLNAQTGPARRNDLQTISEHISMLDGLPREIYEVISRSIQQTYNSEEK